MEQRFTKLWYRDDAGPSFLQPLSWLYDAAVRLRRNAFSRGWLSTHRVGKPVIVIGNLTVGGTGKTPLVIWLARCLSQRGLRVGIVSRGYGSRPKAQPQLVSDQSSWRDVGDEPVLIARASGCLTMVGRDRVAAARSLVAHPVDVILADDGLQHLRLARDCEIVVIDGSRGFGNARMLPAGPLRDPVSRLAGIDLIVVNGSAEHPSLKCLETSAKATVLHMTLLPGTAVRLDGREESRPLEAFQDRPLHAVAGIGNPSRFFRDLRARGLEIIEHPFADHHRFTAGELAFADDLPVLMTEKDAVKCIGFANPRLWVVPAAAVFGETQSRQLLEHVMRKIRPLPATEVRY
jgi:tetraacyldisaccharide 4'-kinase